MNIKKFIEADIVPLYDNQNFKYQYLSPNEFRFLSPDDFVWVFYDIRTIRRGLKTTAKEVALSLSIKRFSGRYTFRPDSLRGISAEQCTCVCQNDDELKTAVRQLTVLFFETIFPTVSALKTATVPCDLSYFSRLAKNTAQQAKAFAERHQRELSYSEESCVWATQWLSALIPKEHSLRRECFQQHIEEIIAFSAFCGELIRLRFGGTWNWFYGEDPSEKAYAVQMDSGNEDGGYNILLHIINFWNYSQDFCHYKIFP